MPVQPKSRWAVMMRDMAEKVALITGGAKRVGRAIVEKFASEGYRVAFTYLSSRTDADALARQHNGCAIRADLTRPVEAVEQVNAALSKFTERLDVLVNSASIYPQADLRQTTPELIQQLMAIHVQSPLLLAQAFEAKFRAVTRPYHQYGRPACRKTLAEVSGILCFKSGTGESDAGACTRFVRRM